MNVFNYMGYNSSLCNNAVVPLCYSVDVPLSPNDLERFDFKFSEFENSKFE